MQGFWWCHNTDIFIYLISGKGLHANSVQCTLCVKWIHKRCSGIRGDLSLLADGFRCNLVALMDWGGANSRFLGLVSVWAARSFDQTALRPSVIKRIRQN